jgi:hypothetical protein
MTENVDAQTRERTSEQTKTPSRRMVQLFRLLVEIARNPEKEASDDACA